MPSRKSVRIAMKKANDYGDGNEEEKQRLIDNDALERSKTQGILIGSKPGKGTRSKYAVPGRRSNPRKQYNQRRNRSLGVNPLVLGYGDDEDDMKEKAQQFVDDAILEAGEQGNNTTLVVNDIEYKGGFPPEIRDIISEYAGDTDVFSYFDDRPKSSSSYDYLQKHRRLLPKRSDFGEDGSGDEGDDEDKDKKQMISTCRDPTQVETMTRSIEETKTNNDAVVSGQFAEESKHDNNRTLDPDTPESQVPHDTLDAFSSDEEEEEKEMAVLERKNDTPANIPNVISHEDEDVKSNIRAILEAVNIPSNSIDWLLEGDQIDVEVLQDIARDLQAETKDILPELELKEAKINDVKPGEPAKQSPLKIGDIPVAQPVKDIRDKKEEEKRQKRIQPSAPVQPAGWYHPHMPQHHRQQQQQQNPGFDPNGRRILPQNPRANPRGSGIDWRATREAVNSGINTIIKVGDRLAPIADDIKRGDAIAEETERLRRRRRTTTETDSPTTTRTTTETDSPTQTSTKTETQKLADSVDTLNPVYGRGRSGAGGFGGGYRPDGTDFLPYVFPESYEIRDGSQLMKNSVNKYFEEKNRYGTGGEVLQNMMYI